jgi:hypothetical protein
MSVQSAVATPGGDVATPISGSTARARVALVTGLLTLSALAVAVVLLWSPFPDRDHISYSSIAPLRDGSWAGYLIETVGYGVAAMGLCIAVCRLVPRRGAVLANIGSVLTVVGGLLFAASALAMGVLSWYATETDAVSPAAGTKLIAYVKDNPGHFIVLDVVGFLSLNLGLLLLAIALGRARTVPRWLPIAFAVLVVGQFPTPGRALDTVQAAIMAMFIAVAFFYRRATTSTT